MKLNKKYRITLEDESSLEKRLDVSARFSVFILFIIAFTIAAGAFGIFIFASTPMKNHLPGYLKESERTATEEQHLRLDSLVHIYEMNEAYLQNVLKVLNPTDEMMGVKPTEHDPVPLTLDSLLLPSEEEKNFMEQIRERDKYNIAYSSPAAAQTMMFGNVSKAAVISEESKNKLQAEIIVAQGSHISSIAEGKVISVASSPKASGAFEVIIQHPKGFLSKTSRLTHLTVSPGDRVAAGQVIALGTATGGVKQDRIIFELWRDGDPLIPARYLDGGS